MSNQPVFRFAPSPNGYLHLGHAFSALWTDKWAQDMGGIFRLRIEDIDTARCKPEFTTAIFEDLRWLGLDWPEPVLIQSQRFDIYRKAAEQLNAMGLIYPCFCTRAEIAAEASGTDPEGAPLYPGTCRHLAPDEAENRMANGDEVQWRLDVTEATRRTGILTYSVTKTPADRPQIRYARPERWGDVVLVRKDTPTSYHLSVVVDDDAEAITHVTRGRDLEAATDIHVLLQFLLGLKQPIYRFHKLITDGTGGKLAKSKLSESLRSLREAGATADEIKTRLGF